MMIRRTTKIAMIVITALAWATSAPAESGRQLVSRGNVAYSEGKYDEALSLYEEASVEVPESAHINYNRGTVHYQKGDYEAATEAFREAAIRAKLPGLAARAKYNLGNCAFREAERQRDSDLKKAIESCQTAIKHYQEVRKLDPDLTQAAQNIEIVRLYVKTLLDEQKKKQEEQEEQDQQENEIVKKLKELIERQGAALESNQQIAAKRPEPELTPEWKESVLNLREDQEKIGDDTGALSQEMQQAKQQMEQGSVAQPPAPSQPQPQAPAQDQSQPMAEMAQKLGAAMTHVGEAISHQASAGRLLAQESLVPAQANQTAATENLVKALAELSDKQDQDQQQQSGDEGNQDEQEEKDQDEQKEGEDQQEQEDQQKESEQKEEEKQAQAVEQSDQKARDILDEEKENKKRKPAQPGRYRPVDKDW